jgi:hypothetical protein
MSDGQLSEAVQAWMREGLECWNSGEIDLMVDMYDPEGEYDPSAAFPDQEPIRGREAMVRHWRELWEVWEGIRMDPLDLVPAGHAGPGRLLVVVPIRLWGKGRRSGVEVDQLFACLYTVREDGQEAIRNQVFRTVEDALAAAERQREDAGGG